MENKQFDLIARHHWFAEPGIVDGHEIHEFAKRFFPSVSTTRTADVWAIASMMRTPGMTGRTGKMAGKKRLVDGDVLDAGRAPAHDNIFDLVDHQEGLAMGNHLHHFENIDVSRDARRLRLFDFCIHGSRPRDPQK